MPTANTLTMEIVALLAQHERETIFKPAKDALTAKKVRGAQVGAPSGTRP